MMEHLNFSRDSNLATALKGWVLDTHTLESRYAWERIFDTRRETERFNGPKSVVGPFDKIRRAGKARRVESLSFSKNRYENFMKFSQQPARTGD